MSVYELLQKALCQIRQQKYIVLTILMNSENETFKKIEHFIDAVQ